MNASAANKTKQRVAIVLGIIAVVMGIRSFVPLGGGGSRPAAAAPSAIKGKASPGNESLDPRLHLDLLANSEDVKYEGEGKNIFRTAPEPIPAVKVSPLLREQQKEQEKAAEIARNTPPPPPPPPPINLKFFGFSSSNGGKPEAFLSQGEDVWIAHEGDVVNRQYKIVRISPNAVEVEDLLNNNRQSIQLTQG
jgi:hypothetical protein